MTEGKGNTHMTTKQKELIRLLRVELTTEDWTEIWNMAGSPVQDKLPADGIGLTEEDIATLDADDWADICATVGAKHRGLLEYASDRLDRDWRDHLRVILDHLAPLAKTLKTPPVVAKGRIQILQWREHGDDDDSCEVRVLGADEADLDKAWIREAYTIESDDEDNPDPEDGFGAIYVNNDMTIADGEILTSLSGRKFRVTIEEVA